MTSVRINTTLGEFVVEMYTQHAPRTCRNFTELASQGYYNNTVFHRVIRDFMIQGGDPTGTVRRRSAVGGRRSVSRRSVSRRQPRGRRDRPRQILNDLRLHFFIPVPRSFSSADDDSSMAANGIQYSERYYDDVYEYRHVVLPPEITKKVGTVELARHAQTRSLTRSLVRSFACPLVRLSARPLVRFSRCQRGG